jgi:hypothetical protein
MSGAIPERVMGDARDRFRGPTSDPNWLYGEASSDLVLNISPIQFDNHEIRIGRLTCGADRKPVLEQLRNEHNGTHVFRCEGATSILAVSVAPDALLIGEPETIRIKEHIGLAAALVRNTLLTYLAGLGRQVFSYEPMIFTARDDLLRVTRLDEIEPPDWLAVRLMHEVAIRPICFFGQEPFLAALVNLNTTRIIERSAGKLMEDGLSLEGFYVGKRVPSKDARIVPHFELLGRVKSREGSNLRLTDVRNPIETVKASDVWPEKRVFAACLSHVFAEHAPRVAEVLERYQAALRHGPTLLDRIKQTLAFLASPQHVMAPGVPFRFGTLLDSGKTAFPRLESAPRPVYVFDQAGSKTDTWHNRGLSKHGPYSSQIFTPKRPRICVVCEASMKDQVEQFLRKFLHGITLPPTPPRHPGRLSNRQTNHFGKGFCRTYALQDIHCEFFLAQTSSADSYKKACQKALEQHGSGQKWDLALVQIEEQFLDLAAQCDPYFVCELGFYTHQIPVQEFQIETTRKPDDQLIHVIDNMGLASYAKLNGTPWVLKASPTVAHELVIGLGSANVGKGRLGKHERYVGITTVFSGDGYYHLTNLSMAVSAHEYTKALLETLRTTILKVQQDMNWQPRDRVRLIFHAKFKRFSWKEVRSIKALVSELGDFDVDYAFIQVTERHPYMLFDRAQAGVVDVRTRRLKGVYAPERGQYLELGSRDVLLWLIGPKEVNRSEDGLPRPLLLSLHRDSTFTDMTYLTRQLFTLACHSWRTFSPTSLPVTIRYPNLIAKKLGYLSFIDRWNPDVMLGRIGKSRWFL